MKLNNLINAMKNHFPRANIYSKYKAKKFCIPLSITCKNKPSIFSFHFKKIYRNSIQIEHPAIQSRLKDSLYFPDKETFNASFQKLFHLNLGLVRFSMNEIQVCQETKPKRVTDSVTE